MSKKDFQEYWDKKYEDWKKNPTPEPFSHPRWTMPLYGKSIGHIKTTYEDELNGLNELMKSGLFDDEWYQEELKIIKERYGVKD